MPLRDGRSATRLPVFVGRARELHALVEAFDTCRREHRGTMVVVHGDSGCGASRLADELRHELLRRGIGTRVVDRAMHPRSAPRVRADGRPAAHRGGRSDGLAGGSVIDGRDRRRVGRGSRPAGRAGRPDARWWRTSSRSSCSSTTPTGPTRRLLGCSPVYPAWSTTCPCSCCWPDVERRDAVWSDASDRRTVPRRRGDRR